MLFLGFVLYFNFFGNAFSNIPNSILQCHAFESFYVAATCPSVRANQNNIYILYDVNQVEGFNLRRDVYIRMSVFVKTLLEDKTFRNTKLVLPPFPQLYHWKTRYIPQNQLFWSDFFDIESMKAFLPVLEFWEFVNEIKLTLLGGKKLIIDNVFQLQHFDNMFENGVFVDKFEFTNCQKQDIYPGLYFQYENITENRFSCLKFQGNAMLLKKVIQQSLESGTNWPKTFLFLNGEIVLHDFWGNEEFWQARRSMRFNKSLAEIANNFRKELFNSTNELDFVQRPISWLDEKPYRGARGGDYICAHLRRSDFIYGHDRTTPTLKSAAKQIKDNLKLLNLDKVFISSDCTGFEYKNLKSYLSRSKVYRFLPETYEQKIKIKDGGLAIIDQIICSHSRYFIGTYESTFTYRIYEEREILGFPKNMTFNTFCKNEDHSNCEKNSVWPIHY